MLLFLPPPPPHTHSRTQIIIPIFCQRLQRLRSWSQDALHRSYVDPATGSSVDSTQPATLTTDEGGDGVGGGGALGQYKIMDPATTIGSSSGMMIGSTTSQQQQQQQYRPNVKSSKKMMFPNSTTTNNNSNIISEPYLDEGEMKPLVYGYLYKLGRNGHWQRRFFETNGERLTYYKNVKRTTVLATLDLCKVRIIYRTPLEGGILAVCDVVLGLDHVVVIIALSAHTSLLVLLHSSLFCLDNTLTHTYRWEKLPLMKPIPTDAPLPSK